MRSISFPISTTLNGRINDKKLSIELHASATKIHTVEVFNQQIFIGRDTVFADDEVVVLENVIKNHDGKTSKIADKAARDTRESKIAEMLDKAHIKHPEMWDAITKYITYLDNYINGFIRTNNSNIIFAKIEEDKLSDEWKDFLDTVINEQGIKAYQFFQSVIQAAM